MIFFSKCKCSRKYHDHRQYEKIPSMPEGIPELPLVPGSGMPNMPDPSKMSGGSKFDGAKNVRKLFN